MKILTHILTFIGLFLLLGIECTSNPPKSTNQMFHYSQHSMPTFNANLYEWATKEAIAQSKTPKKFLQEISSDGSWKDIKYASKQKSIWDADKHWDRLISFALAAQGASEEEKAAYYQAISKGINYWSSNDFRSTNPWWNTIGVPKSIGILLILTAEKLSEQHKNVLLNLLQAGIKDGQYIYNGKLATGQNRLWIAKTHLIALAIEKSYKKLEQVYQKEMANTLQVSIEEGIQADYTFHQHGPIVQNYTYGASLLAEICDFIKWAEGTSLNMEESSMKTLINYLLDGQRWLFIGTEVDLNARGRQVSGKPSNYVKLMEPIVEALLQSSNTYRIEELKQFNKYLESPTTSRPIVGTRYFWRSELMMHHTPSFSISVKTASNRIVATESVNGENLLGYHFGYSNTFIYLTGEEYNSVIPVWDWDKIPGGLISQRNKTPQLNGKSEVPEGKAFAGGVSNSQQGVMGHIYRHDSVSANKAWFLLGKSVVCLISNIKTSQPNLPLVQTINQCQGLTEVYASQSSIKPSKGGDGTWVHHNNIGYLLHSPTKDYHLLNQKNKQKGSWKNINQRYINEDNVLSDSVFTLAAQINKETDRFAYSIFPQITKEKMEQMPYDYKKHFTIQYNSGNRQSIIDNQKLQLLAVHYKGNDIAYEIPNTSYLITPDQPCIFIVSYKDGNLEIYASDPSQKLKQLSFDFSNSHEKVILPLPTDPNQLGTTVYKSIKI